ncbi:MAG: hypothetical protein IJ129_03705, partial [Ruminococcus sp.]|nr:hypothetical protein [Ruminococcus sp.]
MKTKQCPYCHKELSAEAVLCKYCHNLLIDEEGNMSNEALDDDRTRVFSKKQLEEYEDKTKSFKAVDPEEAASYAGASADEVFPENGRLYNEYEDADYEDDQQEEDEDDEARRRMFIITAVITL